MRDAYQPPPANPLAGFLRDVDSILKLDLDPNGAVDSVTEEDRLAYFETKQFTYDVCDRIARMALAYERLCDLSETLDAHFQETMARLAVDGRHEYSAEERGQMAEREAEGRLFTEYLFYELKSVTDMVRQPSYASISIREGSELEYALKVRDRFLSHLCFGKLNRTSGGHSRKHGERRRPVLYDVMGLRSWGMAPGIAQTSVLAKLGLPDPPDEHERARRAAQNEDLLRSQKKNEKLDANEVDRLRAFGARSPDIEAALREFASEILPAYLNFIQKVLVAEGVAAQIGLVRQAFGPLTAIRLSTPPHALASGEAWESPIRSLDESQ